MQQALSGKAGVTLLQGVTGSGKTLVYIRLAQELLHRGKSVMLLVPEIALTPQMMARFTAYFGDEVALLHSGLRLTERYDQFKRIRRGEARIVLGTRSAVFAPLRDIGLIVMDEEQESSYESETAPCYHARDIAKYRCIQEGARLLLGSATPTVETAYWAEKGDYQRALLRRRYNRQALPTVILADLRQELLEGRNGIISRPLYEELQKNLDAGEQSILFLNPNVVIVTNVEADHLDHYSGIEEIEATFAKFMSLVGEDGTVIVCGEDPHLVELAKSTGRHVLSYGFAESNDIVCMHPDVKGIQSDFIVRFEDGTEHAVEIKSNPGRHNMLNATAVLTVAHVLGLDIDAAAKALSSFEGVRRRFTHVGDIDGITVVDDYGHHPTEIKATLAAASSLGYKHVDVVFQPHRYSRLQALCDDFADAFANADKLLLIDVFSAGEMPIPGVTSKMLADTVRAKHPGKEVVYCSSRLELNQELEQMVGAGDLLLTMGAGDVTTVGPEFIEYLTAKKDA